MYPAFTFIQYTDCKNLRSNMNHGRQLTDFYYHCHLIHRENNPHMYSLLKEIPKLTTHKNFYKYSNYSIKYVYIMFSDNCVYILADDHAVLIEYQFSPSHLYANKAIFYTLPC